MRNLQKGFRGRNEERELDVFELAELEDMNTYEDFMEMPYGTYEDLAYNELMNDDDDFDPYY